MRKKVSLVSTTVLVVVAAFATLEFGSSIAQETKLKGDPRAGESIAATCTACHGEKGISTNTLWPNLAGQQEGYLVKSITEFRDGIRTEISMQTFVEDLSDQDIADLATYYNGLSPCP